MSSPGTIDVTRGAHVESRLLGRIRGGRPGPTLICIGGIHGNEPAGVYAIRRVLDALADGADAVSGDLVALAGNVAALAMGRRFVDRDLNRAWTGARIEALRAPGNVPECVEDREQMELLDEIEAIVDDARGPVFALDLHTTSGPGGVFSVFSDALPHRAFAGSFPVPMIFGLEEQVDGTLVNLLSEHGLVAITVETGQHTEPAAVDRAESAIWVGIVAAGLLPDNLVPQVGEARRRLRRDTGHLPRALEVRYRRQMVEGDGFAMEPGYSNFQKVERGETIARDNDGLVVAGEDARLLMPLYQEQGDDGFFLVREFRHFWMHASYVLRRAGAARYAHWLPGVRRVPDTDDELVADKRIARLFARQLFHLLGFRQLEDAGSTILFRRRPFDEARYLASPPVPNALEPSHVTDSGRSR
jgi:succinylglutamate desuccinylase